MLPSRCSSARQRRGPGRVTVQSGGWGPTPGRAACPEAPIWSIHILLQGDPHVLPRWDRWQLRSQAQRRREKLPWLAGSSCSLTVGMCPYLLTYPCRASMLPELHEWLLSWIYRLGWRGDARTREGPQLPCLICSYLSSLELSPGLSKSFSPMQSAWWPGPGSSLAPSGRCPVSLQEGMSTPMERGSLIA